MEITPLGIIVIPLGLLLFLSGSRYLFWAVIISIPFFMSSVINIYAWSTYIRPTYYLLIIFIIQRMLYAFIRHAFNFTKEAKWGIIILSAFIFSSIMPLIIGGGQIRVIPEYMNLSIRGLHYVPLEFSRSSITQLLYPVFWIINLVLITQFIRENELQYKVLQMLIYLSIPVLISGIYYQLASVRGESVLLSSVLYLFFGNAELIPLKYWGQSVDGMPRMCSILGEPSNTCVYLLMVLGPLIGDISSGKDEITNSKTISIIIFFLVVIGIISSGSTSGFIGLLFIFPIYLILCFLTGKGIVWRKRFVHGIIIVIGLSTVILLILSITFSIDWKQLVFDFHLSKIIHQTKSGLIRLTVAKHNIETFISSPLFGVGYGNERGSAVSTFLLANVGLIGTISFYGFIFQIIKSNLLNVKKNKFYLLNNQISINIEIGLLASFVTIFFLMQFSLSEAILVQPLFWVYFAIITSFHKREKTLPQPIKHAAIS